MPRNMSFMLTTEQTRNRTKTVTRRLGWYFLKSGDIVNAVEKGMGLKKGEKIKRICQIRIKGTIPQTLSEIDRIDLYYEGFPNMAPRDFIRMFCKHNKCTPDVVINRIEFEYV